MRAKIAEVPNKVIDKELADEGLLAEIAVQKFDDYLLLYGMVTCVSA